LAVICACEKFEDTEGGVLG